MKKLFFFLLVFTLLSTLVTATTVLTNPSDNEEFTIGSIEELSGTTDLGDAYTCTFYELKKGDASYTIISEAEVNATKYNYTIPNDFGRHSINITCTNTTHTESDASTVTVQYANYGTGDASETIIDLLVGVFVLIVGFASLIGLVLLFNWIRKKL